MHVISSLPLGEKAASSDDSSYKADDELNQKISLFRGDITKLEIDAIINAGKEDVTGVPHITQGTSAAYLLNAVIKCQ